MQIITKVDLSFLSNNFTQQMKFNDINKNNYIQMANLTSGCNEVNTNLVNNSSTRSSFRYPNQDLTTTTTSSLKSVFKFPIPPQPQTTHNSDLIENIVDFIDDVTTIDDSEKKSDMDDPTGSAVYNFPWDFKLKSLMQAAAENPTTPQFPPPALPTQNAPQTETDESQYCSPWDLKLQEKMFKMMSQQQAKPNSSGNNSRNNSIKLKTDESIKNSEHFKRGDEFNSSIKSNKSIKDIANTTIESSSLNTVACELEQNEYSPPWEHKQSLLLQSLTSSNKSLSPPQISAPLATSSAISTLTNSANINQNQAITTLFNQFSRGRLSTRSNTSSSSSSHSSTSSLSTNSPPSIPPPPLPPSIPPPPPPTSALTSLNTSSSLNNNNFNRSVQQNQSNQSPRLLHRHVCQQQQQQNNSNNILLTRVSNNNNNLTSNNTNNNTTSFAIVPMLSTNTNNLITCPLNNTNLIQISNNNSSFLNESNTFWNNKTNQFDTLTSSFDENQTFLKQQNNSNSRGNFSVYPQQQHFQTVPSNQLLSGEIQVALPVTALVFSHSQTSSLSSNLIQQQQQQTLISNHSFVNHNTLSHLQSLERQNWFHGRITRKHAENILGNRPMGSFLVRQSESGNSNDFSLSLIGSGCVHMRICMKNGEFILGQCSQPFNSIIKMIEHYGKVEVPIKGAQHVKLTNPVPVSV